MPIYRSDHRPRTSLLRLTRKRDDQGGSISVWKSLLFANGILLLLNALLQLVGTGSLESYPATAFITAVFCTPITLFAHFGSIYAARLQGRLPRTLVLILIWLVSGALGSLVAYLLLASTMPGFSLPGMSLRNVVWLGNGVIAVAVGAAVLLVQLMRGHYKQRNVLLRQHSLLTAEFEAARKLQMSLLPQEVLTLQGFDISAITEPAVEIGGDYYDYLTLADGTKAVLVADAAGKGVPAALLMAKFQGMAQSLSIHVPSAVEFFVGLNDTLTIRLDRRSFITVGMVTIDFNDRCRFYRAGHNPLLLYRAATGEVETYRPQGLALGLAHGPLRSGGLVPADFTMQSGDLALLYSDGLTEATDDSGNSFDDERTVDALRHAGALGLTAEQTRTVIMERLARFVGDAEPHDDITLAVIRKV